MMFVWRLTHTYTYIKWPFFRATWVSGHQKGKPYWILLKQEMMGWQWHQLDHMQIICTTLQTDNHTSTPPHHSIFYGADALPNAQPTVSKDWRGLEVKMEDYQSSSMLCWVWQLYTMICTHFSSSQICMLV